MDGRIERVYIGLPPHLQAPGQVLWVAEEFRRNDLSFIPGGAEIVVEYQDGRVLGYDRVKFPSSYIHTIFESELGHNFRSFTVRQQIEIMRSVVAQIYARRYADTQYGAVPFQLAWDSLTSIVSPWTALKRFDPFLPSLQDDDDDCDDRIDYIWDDEGEIIGIDGELYTGEPYQD